MTQSGRSLNQDWRSYDTTTTGNFFAGSLAILYAYMIIESYNSDVAIDKLHLLGLGLAVSLIAIELRPSKNK